MDRIVFFHMNQLGDLLFSLPILKEAKKNSDIKIISVVKPSLSPLLVSCGLADKIIPKEKSLIKLIKSLKEEKGGKAVLFSESPSSVLAAYLAGFKERTGFETASLSFLLTKKARRNGVPSLLNNILLGNSAGFENIKSDYTDILNIPQENINNIREWFMQNNCNPTNTIAISTGASKKRQNKCLPESTWVEIIDGLYELGYNCVLTGAPWEKESLSLISKKCIYEPALFTAENGILDSAAFFSYCSLFIGIDSGAMHLAAALKRKCIGIFVKTDPAQIGPMPLKDHIIIRKDNVMEVSASEIVGEAVKYYDSKFEKYKKDITSQVENPSLVGYIKKTNNNPVQANHNAVMNMLQKASFLAPAHCEPENVKKEDNGNNNYTLKEGMTIKFHLITNNAGESFMPAFTDWWEMGKFTGDKKINGFIVTFEDLKSMVLKDKKNMKGFVINPFGENLTFDHDFIMSLNNADKAKAVPVEIKKDTKVLIGEPAVYPHEMIKVIMERIKNMPNVRKAYLQLMTKENEMSYLVIVDFDGNKDIVFQSIAEAAMPFLKNIYMDMIDYSSNFAQGFVNNIKPFYSK